MGGIMDGGIGAMFGGLCPIGGIPMGGKWGGIPGGPIKGGGIPDGGTTGKGAAWFGPLLPSVEDMFTGYSVNRRLQHLSINWDTIGP